MATRGSRRWTSGGERCLDTSLNTSLRLNYQVPGQAKEGGIDLNDALDVVSWHGRAVGAALGLLAGLLVAAGNRGSDDFRPGEGGV